MKIESNVTIKIMYGVLEISSFRIDQRIAFIVGIFAIILFFLITFPWWGLKKKIIYQQESKFSLYINR